jgi:hypothetical protein
MLKAASSPEPENGIWGDSMERIEVNGGKATVALREDGIIHIVWNSTVKIEAVDATAAMAAANELTGGREHPLLVDMTTTASLSRQARAVFGGPSVASRIALLGRSPVDRILANWSMKVQKLPCPTRFFDSSAEAEQWLRLATAPADSRTQP